MRAVRFFHMTNHMCINTWFTSSQFVYKVENVGFRANGRVFALKFCSIRAMVSMNTTISKKSGGI